MRTLKTVAGRRLRATRQGASRVRQAHCPIDVDDIMSTVRVTLDRLPLAATVEHLLLRLRGHIQLLLPETEAKGWARYGQDDQIRLMTASV